MQLQLSEFGAPTNQAKPSVHGPGKRVVLCNRQNKKCSCTKSRATLSGSSPDRGLDLAGRCFCYSIALSSMALIIGRTPVSDSASG